MRLALTLKFILPIVPFRFLYSAVESIYLSNADENVRELCRRRMDAIAHENFQKKLIRDLTDKNEALSSEVISLSNENKSLSDKVTSLSGEIACLRKLLEANDIREAAAGKPTASE